MDVEVDAGGYDFKKENTSRADARPEERAIAIENTEDHNSLYYDMSKKKYLHIFNHFKFSKTREFGNEKPKDREGTHFDVKILETTFTSLGFEVKVHQDLTRTQVVKAIKKLINDKDHTKTSCVALAVLTHGTYDGYLFAEDEPYELKEITKLLEHQKLVMIPKLLFLQACRGHALDKGHQVEVDGLPRNLVHVPSHIDFLILHSAADGHASFRCTEAGSWMMQSLCSIIQKYHSQLDILQLITLVNKRVAFDYTAFNKDYPSYNNKKQTLEARYTLTKFLKL